MNEGCRRGAFGAYYSCIWEYRKNCPSDLQKRCMREAEQPKIYVEEFESLFGATVFDACRNEAKIARFPILRVGLENLLGSSRLFHYAEVCLTLDDQGSVKAWINAAGGTGKKGEGSHFQNMLEVKKIEFSTWKQQSLKVFMC